MFWFRRRREKLISAIKENQKHGAAVVWVHRGGMSILEGAGQAASQRVGVATARLKADDLMLGGSF